MIIIVFQIHNDCLLTIVVTILMQGPKIHTISKGKSAFDIIPDTSFCGVSVCFGTGLKQDVVFSDDITSIGNAAKVTGVDEPEVIGVAVPEITGVDLPDVLCVDLPELTGKVLPDETGDSGGLPTFDFWTGLSSKFATYRLIFLREVFKSKKY